MVIKIKNLVLFISAQKKKTNRSKSDKTCTGHLMKTAKHWWKESRKIQVNGQKSSFLDYWRTQPSRAANFSAFDILCHKNYSTIIIKYPASCLFSFFFFLLLWLFSSNKDKLLLKALLTEKEKEIAERKDPWYLI